ncbi:hypothetical protein MML48_2g00017522 [Holotrichia oblita]|uniref:Uncharacterized protein n=1 Tax=Holotrichia oblita TaxID=644536 RepID=A0ACB9TQJ1_HOLOL|nr:hypothetical protein MML48_2g00017522 [Holotrichia oblita]
MNSTDHQNCCEVGEEAGPSTLPNADTNANITNRPNNECKGAIPKTKPAVKIKPSSSKKSIKFNNNIDEIPNLSSAVQEDIIQVNGISLNSNFASSRNKDPVFDNKSNYAAIKCDTSVSSISIAHCNGTDKEVKLKYCQFSDEDDEDALSISDDGCIYTYKGDQDADLPISFFSLDMPVESPNPINRRQSSSPEMDFLEMDFDPGPSSELEFDNNTNSEIEIKKTQNVKPDKVNNAEASISSVETTLNNKQCSSSGINRISSVKQTDNSNKNSSDNNVKINKSTRLRQKPVSECVEMKAQKQETLLKMPWTCNISDRTVASSDSVLTKKYHCMKGELVSPVDNPQKNGTPSSTVVCDNACVCCYSVDPFGNVETTAMIWTEQEAYLKQTSQIGPSACGATAVINTLNALKFPISSMENIKACINTRLRANSSPLTQYLLSRSIAGTTHKDLIDCLHKVTDDKVYARFFHMYPERVVNLRSWLAFWINKGAVPIATLNLQRCTSGTIPDAWHHQMIFGVNSKGVYLCNPVECVAPELLWPQLSSESILLVRRNDVLDRWNIKTDLPELMNIKSYRWRSLNVVGEYLSLGGTDLTM